jgi:hypothetical protein
MAQEYLRCYSDLISQAKAGELGPKIGIKASSHRLHDVYAEAISPAKEVYHFPLLGRGLRTEGPGPRAFLGHTAPARFT